MKKNLALILALVMLLGTLFSVVPMAEGESDSSEGTVERVVPEVAFANVNYTDKIYMMFAVPVPAALEDGASVKLIAWESRTESIAFSYNDIIKEVLEPEAEKATIDGAEYYVFKYDALGADQMTDFVCVRPVIVKDDVAISYGKVVDYSIREYVASAKGEIDGIAPIANTDHYATLDQMLAFGALAQQYTGDEYDYYADDDLRKIYVVPVLNGVVKDKVFAGFFKYSEGAAVTLLPPFFDGTNVVKVTDAAGTVVEDLDDFTDDLQFEASDADITLTVNYENVTVRAVIAEDYGLGMEVNNYDEAVVGGNGLVRKSDNTKINFRQAIANLSGAASTMDTYNRMNYWHSIKTVQDPTDPDNVVFQFTATNAPAFNFDQITASDFAGVGFGDTIYPAFTFEITLGAVNGKMPSTGTFHFRNRSTATGVDTEKWVDLTIFKLVNGELQLADGTVVGSIPETGMRKFAITVDALTAKTYGYAENEEGVMVNTSVSDLSVSATFTGRQEAHFKNLADEDPGNDTTFAAYENIYSFFTKSAKLEPTWFFGNGGNTNPTFESSSIEIGGVETPIKNADGSFNMDAVKALAERDYSFLLDDYKFTMGAIYDK